MSDDLVPVFIPALVVLLLNQERAKGAPLTQGEVEEIRDRSVVMQMARERAEAMAEERGYEDIDPEAVWIEWRAARRQLLNPRELEPPPTPDDLLERLVALLGANAGALELALGDLPGLDRGERSGETEFWSWCDLGLSLSTAGGQVASAFLYGDRREGFEPYTGALPLDLSYAMSEAEALERCGKPMASSSSPMVRWHKFQQARHHLHLEFTPDGDAIRLVTLLAEREPV